MPLSTTQYGFIIDPMVPFTDASGTTIRNGYVRVFVAGSSTPVITYKNYDGATNEETIQLDNSGRTAYPVIVSKGNTYKVCVYDAEHSQESPILTIDKVVPAGANVEATNIVTGLDNVESPEAGWVKSTVSGTDVEVSLDATNVTSEVDTMVKATSASADYMMPLVHKTGSDPDKKITLGNIFKFVLNFIHSLTDTATESDIASGNYFAIDGSAGTKKLNSTTLLTKTAQNALAGNVAQAFDPTRDNTNPYKAGESVTYTDGKVYTFKVDHYGAWDAADVYTSKGNFVNENFVDISTAESVSNSFIREIGGALDVTGSSDWRTYIFEVQPGEKYKVSLYSNLNYLAIAFLTSAHLAKRYYISGIPAVGTFGVRDYDFIVPDNCNAIAICNRYVSMHNPILFCTRMTKNLPSELFEKNFIKVVDDYTGGIEYNGKVDVGCRVGYILSASGKLYGESGHRTFYIKNKGYNRVEAYIGLLGVDGFAISFFSSDVPDEKTLISGVVPYATINPQYCYGVVPPNCRSIAVCTRLANLATPKITLSITPQGLSYGVPGEEVVEYSRLKRNSVIQQNWSWKGVDGQDEGKHNTLMWFSDIHGDKMAYQKMVKIKDWFFKELVDDVVHTGDLYADHYEADKNFLGDDILNIPGNHDVWANSGHSLVSSTTVVYDALLKGRVGGWSVTQPIDAESLGKNYYYKDYSASNIRVIFLDSQNYDGWNGFFDDNGVQDSWFASVLADAVTNEKNVVVVSHYPPGSISQSWQANGFCTPKDTFVASTFPGLSRVEEFITNGGKFVCWMCAHQHDDQFGLCGTKQIPVIQIASECILRNENTARSFDSLSEHNFNFITFDTAKKLVKVTKYGCNLDSYMRVRNAMCFNYENKTLISAN